MSILQDYNQFSGRHYETGTLANYYAYRGIKAPHTNRPPSEALLMGISGGAVMGYFFFHYEGYDPIVRILTRNTFDPWDTMLSRLGVIQNVKQTTKKEKGIKNLLEGLEEGGPVVVWADHFSLPYNGYTYDPGIWGMLPLLVYGYEVDQDRVSIADRAAVPLHVDTETFQESRARIKKDKYRIATYDPPQWNKLEAAVQAGIWDCISLYTEKPPKGSKNNFGILAFNHWAKLLNNPKIRNSWEKVLPAGDLMTAGLMSAYGDIFNGADRALYGDFLNEAAIILNKPGLEAVGDLFRQSGEKWKQLAEMLLPDDVPPMAEIRQALKARYTLFVERGGASLEERNNLQTRIKTLRELIAADFPWGGDSLDRFRGGLADQILAICDLEKTAVERLRDEISER
ncbi:MAG: BtrH N-terminal domain-containing protein [Ardenticatenaceae bacterium]|nr:BtrH N-terminal domain-containing protein [Ardenticatenaceae bacterium]